MSNLSLLGWLSPIAEYIQKQTTYHFLPSTSVAWVQAIVFSGLQYRGLLGGFLPFSSAILWNL